MENNNPQTNVERLTRMMTLEGLYEAKRMLEERIKMIEELVGLPTRPEATSPQIDAVRESAQIISPEVAVGPQPVARKRRKLSIEARQKIAAAQKARHAALKKQRERSGK